MLFQALRWGGAVYLFWLAWDAWRSAGDPPEEVGVGAGLSRYFRRGFVVNVLNPKAAVFYVAVLPGFVDPAGSFAWQEELLTAIYVAVATGIHAGIVALAGRAARLLTDSAARRMVRRALALALGGVAAWFLWSTGI